MCSAPFSEILDPPLEQESSTGEKSLFCEKFMLVLMYWKLFEHDEYFIVDFHC
jgi:hypothetical protein